MSEHVGRQSAKIYQFPLRARKDNDSRLDNAKPRSDAASTGLPNVVSGGCWYHEEAIRDAQSAGNR